MHAPEEVYDDLLVPALTAAKRDREHDAITLEDLQFVRQATQAIMDDGALRQSQAVTAAADAVAIPDEASVARPVPSRYASWAVQRATRSIRWCCGCSSMCSIHNGTPSRSPPSRCRPPKWSHGSSSKAWSSSVLQHCHRGPPLRLGTCVSDYGPDFPLARSSWDAGGGLERVTPIGRCSSRPGLMRWA
jgi:hypothetical protein